MHVVIVGGGFAGIRAAREISKRSLGKITLISDHSHFLNRATLYTAVTDQDEANAVIELDDIFAKNHDITIVQDNLTGIDPDRRLALCKQGRFSYDRLILALGTTADYAHTPGANKHSYDTATLDHVRRLRQRIYDDITSNRSTESIYTIVGGGTTGVELAGSLASLTSRLHAHYSPTRTKLHIGLMERHNRLLPNHSKAAGRIARKRLHQLGVSVMLGYDVRTVGGRTVTVDGRKLPSDTTIWATGTANSPFYAQHKTYFQIDKAGNVLVNPYLEAYKNIYVLGDNANVHFVNSAHIAIDMGSFIADHLARVASDRPLRPFRPRRHLTTIPIGDDWAYAELGGIYTAGRLGYQLRKHHVLHNYRQIVSRYQALHAWNSYHDRSLK